MGRLDLSRIDALQLYPPFLSKLTEMEKHLPDGTWFVTCGYRSHEEQAKLYAKGRTEPGGRVTNAKPGQSLHQYGIAVDAAFDLDPSRPGLQPSWSDHDLKPLADAAVAVGLEAGFYWSSFRDTPHIQLSIKSRGVALDDLRRAYDRGGLIEVWAFLDTAG